MPLFRLAAIEHRFDALTLTAVHWLASRDIVASMRNARRWYSVAGRRLPAPEAARLCRHVEAAGVTDALRVVVPGLPRANLDRSNVGCNARVMGHGTCATTGRAAGSVACPACRLGAQCPVSLQPRSQRRTRAGQWIERRVAWTYSRWGAITSTWQR
jgi:hypothetical protein